MKTATASHPELALTARLSPRSRRLLNVLVLQAVEGLPATPARHLSLRGLDLLHERRHLRDDLQALLGATLSWTESAGSWGSAPLLNHVDVSTGHLHFAFSPVAAQLLARPPGRARLQCAIQRQDSTGHALAVYELCAPWSGKARTPWWPVAQVRAALGLADSGYYETFKHFNAKILKPALFELARTSDLDIRLRTRRQGRVVAELRFDVALRPAVTVADVPPLACRGLADRLRALGFSDPLARTWVHQAGETGAEAALRSLAPEGSATRAARLAIVHRLVASRAPAQREADKAAFLAHVTDAMDRNDFQRFSWMSARNAQAIFRFWERRAPEAFAALP